jgi:hypothetical protein
MTNKIPLDSFLKMDVRNVVSKSLLVDFPTQRIHNQAILRTINKSWELRLSKTGEPSIKNGVAETLALKTFDEDEAPAIQGQIGLNKKGQIVIAHMKDAGTGNPGDNHLEWEIPHF